MASKNNIFTLEDSLSFEDYAFIFFKTYLKGYQLVAALNKCLGIDLHRIDRPRDVEHGEGGQEVKLYEDADWRDVPVYAYNAYRDKMVDLKYFVVDVWYYRDMSHQLSDAIHASDKVLVLSGSEAHAMRIKIYNQLLSPEAVKDPDDILAIQRYEAWKDLLGNLIDYNYYDYSDIDNPRSSQWENAKRPWSKNLKNMVSTIQDFLSDVVHKIEDVGEASDEDVWMLGGSE